MILILIERLIFKKLVLSYSNIEFFAKGVRYRTRDGSMHYPPSPSITKIFAEETS